MGKFLKKLFNSTEKRIKEVLEGKDLGQILTKKFEVEIKKGHDRIINQASKHIRKFTRPIKMAQNVFLAMPMMAVGRGLKSLSLKDKR